MDRNRPVEFGIIIWFSIYSKLASRSKIDECVFYRNKVIFIVYVDGGIFAAIMDLDIDDAIKELASTGLDIEDQGSPPDYIGVNINRLNKHTYELTQPALSRATVADAGIGPRTSSKPVPLYLQGCSILSWIC